MAFNGAESTSPRIPQITGYLEILTELIGV